MKKTFQSNKKGDVCSYSNGKLKCDKLEQQEISITKSQLEKIESHNYNLFIRDNKLVLEEGAYLARKKEKEKDDKEFETLLTKISDTHEDLIPLLEKIIKKQRG